MKFLAHQKAIMNLVWSNIFSEWGDLKSFEIKISLMSFRAINFALRFVLLINLKIQDSHF
jgi:hypothetical protein